MANITCDLGSLPSYNALGLSPSLNVVMVPGNNVSDAAMTACCAPSSVNLVDTCVEWCEIPKSYFNQSSTWTQAGVEDEFHACLLDNGRVPGKTLIITGYHFGLAPSVRPSLHSLGRVLLAVNLVAFWLL